MFIARDTARLSALIKMNIMFREIWSDTDVRHCYSFSAFRRIVFNVLIAILISATTVQAEYLPLDVTCMVSVLNRTTQAQTDGSWRIENIPSFIYGSSSSKSELPSWWFNRIQPNRFHQYRSGDSLLNTVFLPNLMERA